MSGGSALYTERTNGELRADEIAAVIAWATRDSSYEPRHAADDPERFPRDLVTVILAATVLLLAAVLTVYGITR